jgi:hypothetical protein
MIDTRETFCDGVVIAFTYTNTIHTRAMIALIVFQTTPSINRMDCGACFLWGFVIVVDEKTCAPCERNNDSNKSENGKAPTEFGSIDCHGNTLALTLFECLNVIK